MRRLIILLFILIACSTASPTSTP